MNMAQKTWMTNICPTSSNEYGTESLGHKSQLTKDGHGPTSEQGRAGNTSCYTRDSRKQRQVNLVSSNNKVSSGRNWWTFFVPVGRKTDYSSGGKQSESTFRFKTTGIVEINQPASIILAALSDYLREHVMLTSKNFKVYKSYVRRHHCSVTTCFVGIVRSWQFGIRVLYKKS